MHHTASGIQIYDCGTATQKWSYNSTDMSIRHTASELCLDVGSALAPPCSNAANRNLPFCNTSLSIQERAADIVSRLAYVISFVWCVCACACGGGQ